MKHQPVDELSAIAGRASYEIDGSMIHHNSGCDLRQLSYAMYILAFDPQFPLLRTVAETATMSMIASKEKKGFPVLAYTGCQLSTAKGFALDDNGQGFE